MIPLDTSGLSAGWTTFWNTLTSAWPKLTIILNLVAVVIVAFAFAKWFWQRRNGLNGGNNSGLWGAMVMAGFFALPGVFIPFILTIVDILINFVVKLADNVK